MARERFHENRDVVNDVYFLRHPNIIAYRNRIVSGKRTRAESAASLVHEILFMTAGSKGAGGHTGPSMIPSNPVMYPVCMPVCVRGSPPVSLNHCIITP
jgi:hypothetical protein